MPALETIAAWSNLIGAWRDASRGKRGNPNVAAFEHCLEERLAEIREDLLSGAYRPGRYDSFFIHEPKRRLISAAPFRDRVVHHALCRVTAPLIERSFIDDSFANRVGKGTHRAVDRCEEFVRRHRYVLAMDVRQFFPSIDHAILHRILDAAVQNAQVSELIGRILASGEGVLQDEYEMTYFPGDDLFAKLRPRGLPIGNLTSQLWANAYLSGFDHFVKRQLRCNGYVRYVDDFRLFAQEKKVLWEWETAIRERLAALRLTAHGGAQPHETREGVPFLGFRIYPHRRRVKPRKTVHAGRRLRALAAKCADGRCDLEELQVSLRAWLNHLASANTIGLRKSMLTDLRIKPCFGPSDRRETGRMPQENTI